LPHTPLLEHVAQVDQQRRADAHDIESIDRGTANCSGGAAEIVAAVNCALLYQAFSNKTNQITMRFGGRCALAGDRLAAAEKSLSV
jgi:hypothetical protein